MTTLVHGLLGAAFAACVWTAAAAGADDEADLKEIQQRLAKAWLAGDRAALEPLFAPDWRVTHVDGRIHTRAEVFRDAFETKINRVLTFEMEEVEVRMIGTDAAAVTGRSHATGESSGRRFAVTLRFTDVFERRDGRWQAVRSHATRIAAP